MLSKSNTKKLVMVVLALMLVFQSSFVFAADTSSADGTAMGTTMGTFDGQIEGRKDSNENRVNNYLTSIPSNEAIVSKFYLDKETVTFKNAFISAYRIGFQEGYATGYREVSLDKFLTPVENAYAHGNQAGTIQGQLSGMVDFIQGNKNNWSAAYLDYTSEGSISSRYLLTRETNNYKDSFTNGFKEGFMNAYVDIFQTKNLEFELRGKNALEMNMWANTLTYQEEFVNFDNGNMVSDVKTTLSIDVSEGTVHEPTYLAAFKTQDTFNYRNTKYEPVSGKYTVKILSDRGMVTLKKPMTLSFEYYGSERAGIYQYYNGRWNYKYTQLEDGKLSIEIPAGSYGGGEYAIFIDNKYKNIEDITFNWAYKEIYTLMRRGIVSYNQMYMPNTSITRLDLANLVYNVAAYNDPLKTAAPTINDANSFPYYKSAVDYMVGKKYLALDAKGNFNPNQTVTYRDVENMLSKMFLRDVSWNEVSKSMLMDKFTRSIGTTNKDAAMTKAEAAYMLLYYFQ